MKPGCHGVFGTSTRAPSVAKGLSLPHLAIADGTLEGLKWFALLLMTGDHINKYLFNGTIAPLFNAGRVVLPIFACVLGYNLARPGTLERGAYTRTMGRLAVFGLIATPPFIALGSVLAGWWPLNGLFTLLAAAWMLWLIEQGGRRRIAAAIALFVLAGSVVEFLWPALALCAGVWWYCKRPAIPPLLVLIAASLALCAINRNLWALVAWPVLFAALHLDIRLPRLRWVFYSYYPLHLVALWAIRISMSKAGYLFF
jgi:hypothetical protein